MFIVSLATAVVYAVFGFTVCLPWIYDISGFLGPPIAWYAVLFIAIIPGFNYMFLLVSLLTHKVQRPIRDCRMSCITVLIPAYNARDSICETIDSVLAQRYQGGVQILVVDDGSTDDTASLVQLRYKENPWVELLQLKHQGKALALNQALTQVNTPYFITVDSDTVLHPSAVHHIFCRIVSGEYAAVAGFLLPKNPYDSFLTKMQYWEYSLSIFSVKLQQGFYRSTLVTQGAFSIYDTKIVRELGGWEDCIGEDIVLTWGMLAKGLETSFEHSAIALTDVPVHLKALKRQRSRWARGMIEGFKNHKGILTSQTIKFKSRTLITFNVLFPFVDLAFSIFIPLGIILVVFGNYLLISWLTLLLFPLTVLLTLIINANMKKACKQADYRLPRRNPLVFIAYVFIYQLMLSPTNFLGYLKETLYEEKKW